MASTQNREADLQHRIAELKEQLAAAEASTVARAALRDFIVKHPTLTAADVAIVAAEMRAPGRFKTKGAPTAALRIGKALREARHAKGLSGAVAAGKVGVHGASISGWERGANLPASEHRAALKRVLGVDVDAMIGKSTNGVAAP